MCSSVAVVPARAVSRLPEQAIQSLMKNIYASDFLAIIV